MECLLKCLLLTVDGQVFFFFFRKTSLQNFQLQNATCPLVKKLSKLNQEFNSWSYLHKLKISSIDPIFSDHSLMGQRLIQIACFWEGQKLMKTLHYLLNHPQTSGTIPHLSGLFRVSLKSPHSHFLQFAFSIQSLAQALF